MLKAALYVSQQKTNKTYLLRKTLKKYLRLFSYPDAAGGKVEHVVDPHGVDAHEEYWEPRGLRRGGEAWHQGAVHPGFVPAAEHGLCHLDSLLQLGRRSKFLFWKPNFRAMYVRILLGKKWAHFYKVKKGFFRIQVVLQFKFA